MRFFYVDNPALREDDCLIRVREDAVAEMPADGAREDEALEVAALLDQVWELVVLRDAGDVLLNDWAFVEDLGDVMASGAYQLDPAREGCVVGAGSCEGGQKRVMHIDDALRVGADELRREDLHVPGEDSQIDGMFAQEGHLLLLDRGLVGRGNRHVVEGDLVEVREGFGCLVIADDEREITVQLSGLMAVEKIGQAVQVV